MAITLDIMGFITKDDYIDNTVDAVSEVFELSDNSLTFSKNRRTFYDTEDETYALNVFYSKNINPTTSEVTYADITNTQANYITKSVRKFIEIASQNPYLSKAQIIQYAIDNINFNNTQFNVTSLVYVDLISINNIKVPNKIIIELDNTVLATIWCSEVLFQNDYPNYDINIVTISDNFAANIGNPSIILQLINSFNIVDFNNRIELDKGKHPTTYTRILNIPYKIPNTTIFKDCHFAFNIYGRNGDYIDVLKTLLLDYLVQASGLTESEVIALFPSIAEINEFFIIPRWNKVAIPSQVGQEVIYSQTLSAFNDNIDLSKFIKVYSVEHFSNNSYNVPCTYNNIIATIVNGQHSDPLIKDFNTYYNDLITVSTTSADFARMSQKTQNFSVLYNYLVDLGDCGDILTLYNRIILLNSTITTTYKFKVRVRQNIYYVVAKMGDFTYYAIPRFEFLRLN